jgi:pSer/pThr/pTyr-binding forkhead associated (FHA) protein
VVTVGRLPECDVVLESDTVSRRHAAIIPTPAGPLLVDQSRHGILINDERIQAPRVLAEGESIRIGDSVLLVQLVQKEGWLGISPGRPESGGEQIRRFWPGAGLRRLCGAIGALVGNLAADFAVRPGTRDR